jgi:pimeloyl-ACP methyl ester carboxylesterase
VRTWGASDAPTVLCWHGAGGSSLDFEPAASELVERLELRVVAIDAPGHGQSASRPAEWFAPSTLATVATEVLDELGVEQCIFVGFSWGGSVGCWFAANHPDRTRALGLVEGGHFDFADLPDFPKDPTIEELTAEAERVAIDDPERFGSRTPAVVGAMVYGLSREPATVTYPRLAAGGIPILFVAAEQVEPAPLQRLRRLVPQTEIAQLATSSHDVLREAPGDVARELGDWLGDLPPAPG